MLWGKLEKSEKARSIAPRIANIAAQATILECYAIKTQAILCAGHQGCVANSRPVARIKTGRVSQPITDAADATGRNAPQDFFQTQFVSILTFYIACWTAVILRSASRSMCLSMFVRIAMFVCFFLSFFLYLPSNIKAYKLHIKVGRTERQQELLL